MSQPDRPTPLVDVELSDETGRGELFLDLVRAVAERALAVEGLYGRYELGVAVVSDERIRELNRTHRGHDQVTDVLSFPLLGEDAAEFVLPEDMPTQLGDVVISLDQASRQASEYGHSPEREIAYLTVHGVLHLLGYDDEDEEDRLQMRAREEEVLRDLPR